MSQIIIYNWRRMLTYTHNTARDIRNSEMYVTIRLMIISEYCILMNYNIRSTVHNTLCIDILFLHLFFSKTNSWLVINWNFYLNSKRRPNVIAFAWKHKSQLYLILLSSTFVYPTKHESFLTVIANMLEHTSVSVSIYVNVYVCLDVSLEVCSFSLSWLHYLAL